MKLTIKNGFGSNKVIDLNKDLEFNVVKGEQYIFSSGFSNYILNFKDNQESISLVFNVNGKTVTVELNGIVPFLQANNDSTQNPTAVIINKSIEDKDLDTILDNNAFNGSEILDSLEAIASKPVETGSDTSGNLALISDFQTLLESLGAAAAGPAGAGTAAGDGSTFNSILGSVDDTLPGIAATDRWVNLSESISSAAVETGNNIILNKLPSAFPSFGVSSTSISEGEYAIFDINLSESTDVDIILSLKTTPGANIDPLTNATTDDYEPEIEVLINGVWIPATEVTIPAGSTLVQARVKTIDDVLDEQEEQFTLEATLISGPTTNFDAEGTTTITDESVPTDPDAQTAIVSLVGPGTVVEGETTTDYTVSITQAPETDLEVTFSYTVTDANGDDYTKVESVVIDAGTTSKTFTIDTIDDNIAEGSEDFTVSIATVANGGLEDVRVSTTQNEVTTTITDESVPTDPDAQTAIVSLVGPGTVVEGETTTDYTVSITQAPETDLEVTFSYTVTDANGDDYTKVESVVIDAGTTSKTFTIDTIDDNIAEGSEDFTVSIATVANGGLEDVRVSTTQNEVTTTITDESVPTDPDAQTAIVSLVGPGTVVEGETTTDYTVSITQAPETDLEVTFSYTVTDANGDDYTKVESVVIDAGTTSKTFTIDTIDDNIAEGSEDFTVSIATVANGGLEDVRVSTTQNEVTTTITDESVPTDPDAQTAIVSLVGPGTVVEGETTTDYTVSITQAPETDLEVTFSYTVTDANGDDYTKVESVVIDAGTTSKTFTIDTIDDNIAEGSEDFTVSIATVANGGLEDVRVSTTQNEVTTTITDESVPTDPDAQTAIVSLVGPGTVVEGETTTDYTVSITQAPETDLEVTFSYTVTDANGDDYTKVESVVIDAGTTSKTFTIDTIDDNIAEGSEDFTVSIATVANGGLEDVRVSTTQNEVTTTITDESVPTDPDAQTAIVSLVGPGTVVEGETTTDYTVSITQAPETDLEVTFSYTVTDANGDDYTKVESVVIDAGTTSKTFTIDTIDDNIAEGSEDFTVSIATVANGGLEDVRVSTTQNEVTTTITDESVPTDPDAQTAIVSLVGPGTVVEGETTTDYTVSITQAPETDLEVTFSYTVTDANGDDYTKVESVVIDAGTTSKTFTIDTIDDNIAEGSEDFTVSIATVANGGLEDVRVSTTQNEVTTTITDESVPTDPDAQTAIVSLVGPGTVVEGETTTDYTVSITQAPETDLEVTFSYTVTDANGDDYTKVESVVIDAGTTSKTFTIDTIDDNIAEGSEDFTVSIATVANGGLEDVRVSTTQNEVTTTITDESVPTDPDAQTAIVSLVGPGTVVEGETTTDYTVSITQAPETDLEVTFSYTVTDANGDDYTKVESVVIDAGTTSKTFTIDTIDDNIAEGSEDFTVSIATVANGGLEDVRVSTTQNEVTTTITDESVPTDPDAQTAIVSLVGPGTVVEGETTTDYTVSITQAPETDLEVTFSYTVTDANGDDYTKVESVVIDAGTTSKTFTIDTIDDNIAEGSEDFTVSIATVANGGLEDVRVSTTQNEVTTTITDESVPTDPDAQTAIVSLVGPGTVVEGETTTDYTVSITQAPETDLEVTFSYTVTDANGDDYTKVESVVIDAGTTSKTFTIDTIDDNIAEGSEDFTVSIATVANGGLEDVRVSTTQNEVTTTITDESVPTDPDAQTAIVSLVGPGTVVEGETTTDYTVSITQAPETDLEVTFSYTVTDANGDDYTKVESVVIDAGTTSKTFTIDTIDDNIAEGSEDFTVSIATVANGGLEDVRVSTTQNEVTTTITDESVPTDPDAQTAIVSLVGPGTVVEGETTTDYTVSITQAPETDLEVTFSYTVTDANGDDYTKVESVVIDAGTTSKTFTIDTIDDNIAEGSEDFTVSIATVANGGLEDVRVSTTQNEVTTTITDESVPTDPDAQTAIVSLVGPGTVVEGETTTDYTVSITQAPETDLEVTFSYTVTDANGDDYTKVESVVIDAGTTSKTFTIDTIDDNIAEGSEDFTVSIATVANGGLEDVRVSTTQNEVTTTITDESVPTDPDAQTAIVSLVGPGTVVEGETTTDYTVSITQAPETDLEVTFSYTVTDANGDDYTKVESVVIDAGTTSKTFTIDTIDDNIAEGSEDFTVSIATVANGGLEDVRVSTTQNEVTTTITDESVPTDPDAQTAIVSLVGPGTVVEGETTTDYTVSITQAPETDLEVTFSYTVTDANGDDYTKVESVVIDAGTTSKTFTIDTIDDNIAEGSEDFTVSIATVANGGLEDVRVSTTQNEVTTTITDESVPTDPDAQTAIVSLVGPGTVVEGETTTDYTVSITQAPETDLEVTFSYTVTDANGDDYTKVESVVIDAGTTSKTFTIDTIDDNIAEGSEDFTVSIATVANGGLEDVRVSTTQNEVTTTITDESVPTDPDAQTAIVSLVGPGTVVEGETTTDYTVSITQAPETDLEVTFSYTVTDANGDDYTKVESVVIDAGTTSKTFTIDTIDDNIAEGSEDFTVSIATVANGGLEDVRVSTTQNEVTTTITDNDTPIEAINDISNATETGDEFIAAEDEIDDGLSATGNVLSNDTSSNVLYLTQVTFNNITKTFIADSQTDTSGKYIEIDSDYGSIKVYENGAFTYDVNETVTDSWNTDKSEIESFTYVVSDGINATDTATLSISVEGRDDAPVITSITGNNQGYKVVDGLLDINGDGVVDIINPDDLTNEDRGVTFLNESGDLNIDMGDVPSSMTVEYNGGQAGYHNAFGYYTKDDNGDLEAHIIYVEDQSMVGIQSEMLGTLNNLTGEIGFFIIPDGGDKGITTASDISFDSAGDMIINGTAQKVFYTDNDLNKDGLDHVVAGMAENGSSLVIAFEDLQLGDRDYDDVVITINACESLSGKEYTVDLGKISESEQQYSWNGDSNDNATWSNTDSNGNNVVITALGFDGQTETLIDDGNYQLGVNDNTDTSIHVENQINYDEVNDKSEAIVLEFEGNLNHAEFSFTRLIDTEGEQGHWAAYKDGNLVAEADLNGIGDNPEFTIDTGNQVFDKIVFTAIQYETGSDDRGDDSSDYYLQSFQGSGPSWANGGSDTILTDINLSDIDDAYLEGAEVKLTNFQTGDVIESPTNTYGITVSITNGSVSLTGTATKEQYEEVLESLTFTSTSEDRTPRTFEFTVNDGDKNSNTMNLILDIGGCELNPHTLVNSVDANDDYGQTTVQGEIAIDAAVSGAQESPDITYLDDGGYVLVWEEINGTDYSGAEYNNDTESILWVKKENHDIFAQRFDKDGEAVGDAIQVNTFTTRDQHDANVTALTNGRFLVTWTSDDDYINVDANDNASRYIKGRIFDESNNPVCDEFVVSRAEYDPIVGLPDGGFIVTWSADDRYDNTDQGTIDNPIYEDVHDGDEFGVFGQRFDAYGNEVGDRFQINTETNADQMDSDITLDSNGDIVVAWQSENQDGDSYGIYTQKFELTVDGVAKVGSEVQVNTTTNGAQTDPEITALLNGKAIVTWENGTDIYAQILNEDGSKLGNEINVSSNISTESNPVVTAISSGFIITWQSDENGNNDIFTQQFDIDGNLVGSVVTVNTNLIGEQIEPAVSTLSDGGYIITWQNGDTISAQRFNEDGSKYETNSYDFDEDTSITISTDELMLNDTDPEGHTFEVTTVSNSVNGTVVLNDTNNDGIYDSVTFTPDEDYNGPATFDYTITDELGANDTATVHLDVKPKGEPTVFVGTLCDADIKGTNVIVDEGEEAILAVRVSGAEIGSTVSLALSNGTAVAIEDYDSTFFYSFVNANTDMNDITWIEYTGDINVPENASTMIVKTNTVSDTDDEIDEIYNLTATLSTGEVGSGTVTIIDNNTPPSSTNDSITLPEDTIYTFSVNDFGTYTDSNGDIMTKVKIDTLPINGTLKLDGVDVSEGDEITVTEINAALLVFVPTLHTDADSSFNFKVSDGEDWSNIQSTTVSVVAVADQPVVTLTVSDPCVTINDTSNVIKQEEAINSTLGGVGDSVINGTVGYDYDQSATRNIDFGSEFAYKTINVELDVTINGSWNNDGEGSYHDDFWAVLINGSEEAKFHYTADNLDIVNPNEPNSITTDSNGVTVYNYGDISRTNDNISDYDHKYTIQVQLDSDGKAEIGFAAATTMPEETVTINGFAASEIVDVNNLPDTYEYNIDLTAALADRDGSEELSVRIEGIPDEATFDANDQITELGNGVWEVDIPSGTLDVDTSLTMTIVSDSEPDFTAIAVAKASDNDISEAQTLTFDEDIDLSVALGNHSSGEISAIDMTNEKVNTLNIDLDIDAIIDLTDDSNELIIKGDMEDKVDLDINEWDNNGKENVDGVDYNVYKGTGSNSTIKILIEDDIDINI